MAGYGRNAEWWMNHGGTVFAQLMDYSPSYEFRKCVDRYQGDARHRGFSCLDQYLAMAFAQLTYRESLRDIEACLGSISGKLYHMGFRGRIARTNLADANEAHDWRIFADFAQVLIGVARPMYAHDPIGVDLDHSLYALDSTTIDLCLSLFPWARFRAHKGAVKLHTLLDLRGNIPTFIGITDGKVADVTMLDEILPEAGAFYVMDRGYLDFERLYVFTLSAAFFVTRTKKNVLLQRRYSHDADPATGVRSDHTVILTAINSIKAYPDTLRRVTYVDPDNSTAVPIPDQQLRLTGTHDCKDLQIPLAGRTVLQMDQTASSNQGVLWDQRERREDSDLDCRRHLRACGHRSKAARPERQPLPDSTDLQPYSFRENAAFTGVSGGSLPGR